MTCTTTQLCFEKPDSTHSSLLSFHQEYLHLPQTDLYKSLRYYDDQVLKQFCHNLLLQTTRRTLDLIRIMIIESIKEVQIRMQIHIF